MSELINCINNLSAKDIIKSIAKTANGTPFYINTVGLGSVCAQYQAVYDYLTTKPSDAIAANQEIMCCTLVDAGIWQTRDLFYLLGQTTDGAGESLVNWVTPGTYNCTLVNVPTFVALEGWTGTGAANGCLTTNYNPTTPVSYTHLTLPTILLV